MRRTQLECYNIMHNMYAGRVRVSFGSKAPPPVEEHRLGLGPQGLDVTAFTLYFNDLSVRTSTYMYVSVYYIIL